VAIVDDEDDLIPIYKHVVKSLGFKEEFVASNGVDMVDAIASGDAHPDLVIMDYRMPRMDGLEAAALISDMDSSVRVVLVTADDSVLQKAKDMHIEAVQKPFSLLQLKDALRAAARA
jgi:CheY-like chemotaxis protein